MPEIVRYLFLSLTATILIAFSPVCAGDLYSEACEHASISQAEPEEMFNFCMRAAEAGHAPSQFLVGSMYFEGMGTGRNVHRAAKWWLDAANAGVKEAQHNIGRLFQRGIVFNKNYQEAFNWYIKAAKQGDLFSNHKIGFMLQNGFGVKKNPRNAIRWYQKSAQEGLASSQYNMAVMYHYGEGAAKNDIESYAWMQLAAEAKYLPAMEDIAVLKSGLTNRQVEEGGKLAGHLRNKHTQTKSSMDTFAAANGSPSDGDEEIVSRLAFRAKNSTQVNGYDKYRDIEKDIVMSLASFLRLKNWKRIAVNLEITFQDTNSPINGIIALYVGEDNNKAAYIDYISLPFNAEDAFVKLHQLHYKENARRWDRCEMMIEANGNYTLNFYFDGEKRINGLDSNERYDQFGEDQLNNYLKARSAH
jgi:TPR repeat protein